MRRIAVLFVLLFSLSYLLACSSTTSGHTGIVSYDEQRAKAKDGADVPRISFAISMMFREKPTDGAISKLVDGITDKLPGHISPWGAAGNSLALTPAAGLNSIESGRRGQVFLPFYIDNPRGESKHIRITLEDIRGAAQEALAEEGVPPGKLDGVIMDSLSIEIHSTKSGDSFDGFYQPTSGNDNGA